MNSSILSIFYFNFSNFEIKRLKKIQERDLEFRRLYGDLNSKPEEMRKKHKARKKLEPQDPPRKSKRVEANSAKMLISCPMCDVFFSEMSDLVKDHLKSHI